MSSLGAVYDITLASLRAQSLNMARLQEQGASGSRINRPSDAPTDAFQVMDLMQQVGSLDSFTKNLDRVNMDLGQTSNLLQGVTTNLTRVGELMSQAANGTYSQTNRTSMADEIDSLLEHMVSLANTKSLGRSLFGGASFTGDAYQVQREGGKITSVQYAGSATSLSVPIAPGVDQAGTLVGDDVFRSKGAGTPTFLGHTGAAAGTGTSNVRGDVWLTVTHGTTTFAGTTGIKAGASSSEGDTIIGSHSLMIEPQSKTVRLDSGAAVAYTDQDTNLCVQDADGNKMYVDLSGLDPSLAVPTVLAVQSTGKLSIDDGLKKTDIVASGNQAVVDSRTGRVLYVNTNGITRTGVEPVQVSGSYDLFGMLISARDVLANSRGLSSGDQTALIEKSLSSLSEVTAGITQKNTALGGRLQAIENLSKSMENIKSNTQTRADSLTQVDAVELSTELARAQTFYQMTLMATAKVMNLSLLNYLPAGG